MLSVTIYVWMYGLDGDLRIRSTEADFDVGFGDILENLDIALMFHVEAWKVVSVSSSTPLTAACSRRPSRAAPRSRAT